MSRYAALAREIVGEDPPPLSDWQRERIRAICAPTVARLVAERAGRPQQQREQAA